MSMSDSTKTTVRNAAISACFLALLALLSGYVSWVHGEISRVDDAQRATAEKVSGIRGTLHAMQQQLDRIEGKLK